MRPWFFIFLFCLGAAHAKAIEAVVQRTQFFEKNEKQSWAPVLDVYWQANATSLNYSGLNEKSFQVKLMAVYELHGTQQYTLSDTLLGQKFATIDEAIYQVLASQVQFKPAPGNYLLKVTLLQDGKSKSVFNYSDSVVVEAPKEQFFLSQIQILDTIVKREFHGAFAKNGFYHFPRPYHFFDSTFKTLNTYSEIYTATANAQKVLIKTYVSKIPFGATSTETLVWDTMKVWRQGFKTTRINLAYLPSGNYYLCQELFDSSKQLFDRKSLFFQLLQPKPAIKAADSSQNEDLPVMIDLATTFVKKYDMMQLKAILKMIRPIATDAEAAYINNLGLRPDDMTIRNFIYNFWLQRNPTDPEKPWNEYVNQIRYINKEFGSSTRPGYESEQGYVYLKYGKPNDIIRVQNESGAYPYELWQYYSAGNTGREGVFLFYLPGNALGSYTLLHSTVRGERINKAWRQQLYPGGVPSNSFSSKAVQYIGNK